MDNKVGNKIRVLREEKRFSQDFMAVKLDITQPSYARLEKDDNRISIPRIIQIANILETTVTKLVGENAQTVINNQNSENAASYVHSTINADKAHIQSLKAEIDYLKKMLANVMEN